MKRNNRGVLYALDHTVDILINSLALLTAHHILYGTDAALMFSGGALMLALILLALLSLVYQMFGVYAPIPYNYSGAFIYRAMLINIASLPVILSVEASLIDGDAYRKTALLTALALGISAVILTVKRTVILLAVRNIRRRSLRPGRVLLVGDNRDSAAMFMNEADSGFPYGMRIIGSVGTLDFKDRGIAHLGQMDELIRVLEEEGPNAIVFALSSYDPEWLIEAVNAADDMCIKVYFLPVIHGYFRSPGQVEIFGAVPLINVHSTPLDAGRVAFLKRAVDIVLSLFLILLTLPLMLFAAVGVKLTSDGPALFKQTRVGRFGRNFTMLKFRSMRVNSESDTAWSNSSDARKTRFGAFLRRTSVDELPQLFNVLRGDMSLVGPRPEIPHFVEIFKKTVPLYMVKHYVRPGMTGLAQIKGLRGDTSIEARIAEDIYYIEHWSLGLDLWILLRTPFAAFNKSERYVGDEK